MNKKSALATAGALTASFVAGAAAVSFNWGLGTTAATSAAAHGGDGGSEGDQADRQTPDHRHPQEGTDAAELTRRPHGGGFGARRHGPPGSDHERQPRSRR